MEERDHIPVAGPTVDQAQVLHLLDLSLRGEGRSVVIEGPPDVGKSSFLRWLADEARRRHFTVLEGSARGGDGDPLHTWELLSGLSSTVVHMGTHTLGAPPPRLVLVEGGKIEPLILHALEGAVPPQVMIVSRERADTLTAKFPEVDGRRTRFCTLSRVEGPDRIAPTDIDGLGARLAEFFRTRPGSRVLLSEFQYLVTQNSFLPVFRLIEYLREEADSTGGTLAVGVNPTTLEPREMALLHTEADEVFDDTGGRHPGAPSATPEPRMLAILDRLVERSHKEPLVILLENLEDADPLSLRCFELLCRSVPGHRILLAGTLREVDLSSDFSGDRPGQLVSTLASSQLLVRLPLGPSSVQGPADRPGDLAISGTVPELASGVPLSGSARSPTSPPSGSTDPGPKTGMGPAAGTGAPQPLPVRFDRWMSGLSPPERKALEWGVVIGPEFSEGEIAGLSGLAEPEVHLALLSLSSTSGLLNTPTQGRSCWEIEPSILEVARARLFPEGEWAGRAAKAAEWLSQHSPNPTLRVARLYFAGGAVVQGREWARRALEEARRNHSINGVLSAFALIWNGVEDAERSRAELARRLQDLAQDLVQWGGAPEATSLLRSALGTALDQMSEWRIRCALAATLVSSDRPAARSEALRLREELAQHGPDAVLELWTRTAHALARSAMFDGDYAQAAEYCNEALERIQRSGDPQFDRSEASLLYWSAWSHLQLHHLDEAWALFRRALSLALRLRAVELEVDCLNLEGELFSAQGDYLQAERAYEESVIAERRLGRLLDMAIDQCNLAGVQVRMGKLPEAQKNASEALSVAARFHAARPGVLARNHLGRIALHQGQAPEARRLAEEALQLAGPVNIPWLTASANLVLAEVYLAERRPELADPVIASLRFGAHRMKGEDQFQLFLLSARVEMLAGRTGSARAHLEAALELASRHKNQPLADTARQELEALGGPGNP